MDVTQNVSICTLTHIIVSIPPNKYSYKCMCYK